MAERPPIGPDPWTGAVKRLARELHRRAWQAEHFGSDGRRFIHAGPPLITVIATRAPSPDPAEAADWLHVSVSHPAELPTWAELKAVKVALIGAARFAYVVFPPASQYVNRHPFALHLWARWDATDGAALPDFVGSWRAMTGELSL